MRSGYISLPVKAIFTAVILAMFVCLAGCASSQPAKSETYQVGSMKGATSIGLAELMQEQDALANDGKDRTYDFTVLSSADEIVPKVAAGDFDFALVPANLAAKFYKQTEGDVRVVAINTLGVLYGVAYDGAIDSTDDLAGRTVYMTGKGSVPGYTFEYLLQLAGIADKVTIEYKSEPSEALAALQNNHDAVAILPEPFATASLAKDAQLSRVLDITALWDEAFEGTNEGGKFITGVTIARAELIDNNPEAVSEFLDASKASVEGALEDPASIADELVSLGILGDAKLADSVVERCNIVCITGNEMKTSLSGYLEALLDANPESIGGVLPSEDFYYVG